MKNIIKFGKLFFSKATSKLYDSKKSAIFETKKAELRAELKARKIHGSWEWLFLPFLSEGWLEQKKENLFILLEQLNVPLKSNGIRVISHDSVGHYGPCQVSFMSQMLSMTLEGENPYICADLLNKLGQDIFYIKPKGEEPKQYTKFYSEWAEVAITKLVAEEKEYETNIPFSWEKLEEMKNFFSEATIRDSGSSTFGNTGEPCLYLNHPSFESSTGITGYVSRTFLKKFCKEYKADGESEHIHFSHHYGSNSLPDLRLWRCK